MYQQWTNARRSPRKNADIDHMNFTPQNINKDSRYRIRRSHGKKSIQLFKNFLLYFIGMIKIRVYSQLYNMSKVYIHANTEKNVNEFIIDYCENATEIYYTFYYVFPKNIM